MPQVFVLFIFIFAACWLFFCITDDRIGKGATAIAGVAVGINFINLLNLILKAS